MSTPVASVTPQTAPRDPAALEKLGIFQIRLLIEKLGGLSNEQEKVAFARFSTPEKVQLALQLLNQYDKAGGGGRAPSNGVAPGTMAMPMPMQVPSMEVNPAALAAAAQAMAPQAAPTGRRSPRTPSDMTPPAAPADLGADVLNMLNKVIQQNDETNAMLAGALKEVLSEIKEISKSNHQLAQSYSAVYGALQGMGKSIEANSRQGTLTMALVLPLAEQVLGCSRNDVLGATLSDVDSIQEMLNQVATPGKAG